MSKKAIRVFSREFKLQIVRRMLAGRNGRGNIECGSACWLPTDHPEFANWKSTGPFWLQQIRNPNLSKPIWKFPSPFLHESDNGSAVLRPRLQGRIQQWRSWAVKVRCVKKDAWVTIGKEYLILGIYGQRASFKYRLIGDDRHTPALHDEEIFELSSPEIPDGWIFRAYPASEWEMTPAAWASDGFWTAYFDGDAAAKALFSQVLSALH
jgi:hypothetical protein